MIGPDDDFGGYEEYEASPYNGDDQDGAEFATFGPEAVEDEESDDEDEADDEEPLEDEDEDGPGGEDAFLDSMMEDRISGFSGFEMGE
jgi:hypothetical protein